MSLHYRDKQINEEWAVQCHAVALSHHRQHPFRMIVLLFGAVVAEAKVLLSLSSLVWSMQQWREKWDKYGSKITKSLAVVQLPFVVLSILLFYCLEALAVAVDFLAQLLKFFTLFLLSVGAFALGLALVLLNAPFMPAMVAAYQACDQKETNPKMGRAFWKAVFFKTPPWARAGWLWGGVLLCVLALPLCVMVLSAGVLLAACHVLPVLVKGMPRVVLLLLEAVVESVLLPHEVVKSFLNWYQSGESSTTWVRVAKKYVLPPGVLVFAAAVTLGSAYVVGLFYPNLLFFFPSFTLSLSAVAGAGALLLTCLFVSLLLLCVIPRLDQHFQQLRGVLAQEVKDVRVSFDDLEKAQAYRLGTHSYVRTLSYLLTVPTCRYQNQEERKQESEEEVGLLSQEERKQEEDRGKAAYHACDLNLPKASISD